VCERFGITLPTHSELVCLAAPCDVATELACWWQQVCERFGITLPLSRGVARLSTQADGSYIIYCMAANERAQTLTLRSGTLAATHHQTCVVVGGRVVWVVFTLAAAHHQILTLWWWVAASVRALRDHAPALAGGRDAAALHRLRRRLHHPRVYTHTPSL